MTHQVLIAPLAALALLAGCAGSDGSEEPATPLAPGTLLSKDDIASDALIPGAGKGVTFTYASTNGLDGQSSITVTGAVYLPDGEAPEGGWPLIAWSHGTVGIADSCAPSKAGRSDRDLTYLSNWLEKGYAIVASDYQGLGSEGLHPYMASRPMGYSNLDAIRAVQGEAFPVTNAVVVTGQSQGAAGAIATAGFQPTYAPEIELKAISATGVPYFPPAIQEATLTANLDTPSPNLAYNLYLITLAEELDENFSAKDAVAPDVQPTLAKAYDQCVFELYRAVGEAELTPRDLSTSEITKRLPMVFEALAYPTLTLPVPAFIGTGEIDTATPLPMQQAFVTDACAAGSTLEARVYEGAGHDGGLIQSMSDVEVFVAKAFAGEPLLGNCPSKL